MKIFLFDVPILIFLGYLIGVIYAKKLYEKNRDAYFFLYIFFVCIFWLNIILSYFGIIEPWVFCKKYCVEINKFIGLFYVLSYPLWFGWGTQRAWDTWGRTPQQGGVMWFIGYKERAKPFKPLFKKASQEDRRWKD